MNSDYKKKINIGIIGTGIGLQMHLPAFRLTGKANIVGVAGKNQYRAEEFASNFGIPKAFGDYRKLCDLPEVDLICATAPTLYHYEHVLYAVQQGKHVLAEKPLALSMRETEELSVAVREIPQITLVNHQLRFNPYMRKIRDFIRLGAIGRPYFIRIHKHTSNYVDQDQHWSWLFNEKMGGGIRLAVVSHLIDLL